MQRFNRVMRCSDGEAVACGEDGIASFDRIRYRRHDASAFLYGVGGNAKSPSQRPGLTTRYALGPRDWGAGGGASDSNADISHVRLKLRCKQRLGFSPLSTALVWARTCGTAAAQRIRRSYSHVQVEDAPRAHGRRGPAARRRRHRGLRHARVSHAGAPTAPGFSMVLPVIGKVEAVDMVARVGG